MLLWVENIPVSEYIAYTENQISVEDLLISTKYFVDSECYPENTLRIVNVNYKTY
jgi:hypothetical protein